MNSNTKHKQLFLTIRRNSSVSNIKEAVPVFSKRLLKDSISNLRLDKGLKNPETTEEILIDSNSSVNVNPNENTIHKEQLNYKTIRHLKKPLPVLSSIQICKETKTTDYTKMQIESKNIRKGLRNSENKSFSLYVDMFAEVISKDKIFGKVLKHIKHNYDEHIKGLTQEKTTLTSSLTHFSERLNNEITEKLTILKQLDKLSRENFRLGNEVETANDKLETLQTELTQLSQLNATTFPQTEAHWQLLLAEVSSYKSLTEHAKAKYKTQKSQTKALSNILSSLEQQGTPIFSIYSSYENTHCETKPNDSDDDYPISSPLKNPPKPSHIPSLTLPRSN